MERANDMSISSDMAMRETSTFDPSGSKGLCNRLDELWRKAKPPPMDIQHALAMLDWGQSLAMR
jgi:hypothetical protein